MGQIKVTFDGGQTMKKNNIPHAILVIGKDGQPYIIVSEDTDKKLKSSNKTLVGKVKGIRSKI